MFLGRKSTKQIINMVVKTMVVVFFFLSLFSGVNTTQAQIMPGTNFGQNSSNPAFNQPSTFTNPRSDINLNYNGNNNGRRVTWQGNNLVYYESNLSTPVTFSNATPLGESNGKFYFSSGGKMYAINYNSTGAPYQTTKEIEEGSLQGKVEQFGLDLWKKFMDAVKAICLAILSFFGGVMWLAGYLFDTIIALTVTNLRSTLTNFNTFINQAWTFFRDLSNIIFIFLILISAIKIILEGDLYGQKKTLSKIIVVALIINFSLFFTKLVIDVSNIATTGIYSAFLQAEGGGSLSSAAMGYLRVVTFWNLDQASAQQFLANDDIGKWILLTIFGSTIMFITAIVFFAASFMFVIRFFIFFFSMILSPLAIVSTIVPTGGKFFSRWWEQLLKNAFYAPVFFILLYITFLFADNAFSALQGTGAAGAGIQDQVEQGFSAIVSSTAPGPAFIALVLNFILVLVFLFFTIFASNKVSAAGAGGAQAIMNVGSRRLGGVVFGGTARLGRNTVGRAGNWLADSALVKRLEANTLTRGLGSSLKNIGETTAKASFDARNTKGIAKILKDVDLGKNEAGNKGYKAVFDQRVKDFEDMRKHTKEESFAEKDAAKISKGAELITKGIAAKIKDEETLAAKIGQFEEAKKKGEATVLYKGANISTDDAIKQANVDLAKMKSNVSLKDREDYVKFTQKNDIKKASDLITEFTRYTAPDQAKFLQKQNNIAKRVEERNERFMKSITEGNWADRLATKMKNNNYSAVRGMGTVLHWAGGTDAKLRRTAGNKISEAESKKEKNKKQLDALIKSSGIDNPAAPPPPGGGAPPPPTP